MGMHAWQMSPAKEYYHCYQFYILESEDIILPKQQVVSNNVVLFANKLKWNKCEFCRRPEICLATNIQVESQAHQLSPHLYWAEIFCHLPIIHSSSNKSILKVEEPSLSTNLTAPSIAKAAPQTRMKQQRIIYNHTQSLSFKKNSLLIWFLLHISQPKAKCWCKQKIANSKKWQQEPIKLMTQETTNAKQEHLLFVPFNS